MTYVLWEAVRGDCGIVTVCPLGDKTHVEPDAVEIARFEAADDDDACRQRNEFMGWGPYRPWGVGDCANAKRERGEL